MDKDKESTHQPRRNSDRPRGHTYRQLTSDIAQPLAERQEGSSHHETGISGNGNGENETERRTGDREQTREINERRGTNAYQQLPAAMAQPLAVLQVSGANNETSARPQTELNVDGREETAVEKQQNVREQSQDVNERRKTLNPYFQLAADTARPLAELQVFGDSNTGRETSRINDSKIESEIEYDQGGKPEAPSKGKQKPRNHYVDLAADLSRPLGELRVPSISDDRASQQEAGLQSQFQTTESVARQGSLSEYDPNATCGSGFFRDRSNGSEEWSISSQSEATESSIFPRQESLPEYNPDATCGSTCRPLSSYADEEMQTEGELNSWGQREATESSSYQESLSEYNPDATCGTGYWQQASAVMDSFTAQESLAKNGTDHSGVQSDTEGLGSKETSWTGDFPKSLAENDTHPSATEEEDGNQQKDSYYSKQDGEPCTKKPKPNPEVPDHLSLSSHPEHFHEETGPSFGSALTLGQGSISEMSSTMSEQFKSMTTEDTQENVLLNDGARSRDTECLSSEFEHMNIDEYDGVEPSTVSYSSVTSQTSDNVDSLKSATQESLKDIENGASYSSGFETQVHNQVPAPMNENAEVAGAVSGESLTSVNSIPQGARPKTKVKVPKGKKNKTPKQNTKNPYNELAKTVSADLSALNIKMDNSRSGKSTGNHLRDDFRDQELLDGGSSQAAGTSNSSGNVSRSEFGQVNARQQPSEEQLNRPHEGNQSEDWSLSGDGAQLSDQRTNVVSQHTHATSQNKDFTSQQTQTSSRRSRNSPEARAAAEYCRQQVQEQQKLIDNMAPELQALVIEMIRRDEEELGGGHVLRDVHFQPPIPPREQAGTYEQTNSQEASVQGASQKSGGKKSKKGKKKKGHYVELAGLIAPELTKLNGVMNGHREEHETTAANGAAGIDRSDGANQGAVGHSPHEENGSLQGMRHNGAYSNSPGPSYQGAWGGSSRGQSHVQSSQPNRQRRGNGNHSMGKCPRQLCRRLFWPSIFVQITVYVYFYICYQNEPVNGLFKEKARKHDLKRTGKEARHYVLMPHYLMLHQNKFSGTNTL